MSDTPSDVTVWFGVMGGPVAWIIVLAVDLYEVYFDCGTGDRGPLPLHVLQIGVGCLGILTALASSAVALRVYRMTGHDAKLTLQVRRGFGGKPPRARVHFLATCGLVVNFLALAILVMTTIGAPALLTCQQS